MIIFIMIIYNFNEKETENIKKFNQYCNIKIESYNFILLNKWLYTLFTDNSNIIISLDNVNINTKINYNFNQKNNNTNEYTFNVNILIKDK